jgi:hypothetical protein
MLFVHSLGVNIELSEKNEKKRIEKDHFIYPTFFFSLLFSIFSILYTKAPRPPTLNSAAFCSSLLCSSGSSGSSRSPLRAGLGKNPTPAKYAS